MMPFYQLAIALADSGLHVSYISTPKNTHRLPKPPQNLSPNISFVSLPLPVLDSSPLPEGTEATVDLISDEQVPYLFKAFDLLQKPLEKFVVEHSPDWLIIDLFTPWATDVGKDCGVPVLVFSPFSAATCLFWGPPEYLTGDGQKRVRSSLESLTSPPEWVTFPSSVAYHNFEAAGTLNGLYGDDASGISPVKRFAKTINASQAIAIRHSRELGGEYLSLYAKLIGKPAIPAGLLPPEKPKERQITDESWTRTFKWLDQQEPRSVLFVGFGSECKLSREQVHEIAYGLEESELPFLWALRKPHWAKDDVDHVLPPGFAERRTFDHKQKVCFGWAPQMEILAHPSIGGSLFHAGWGSAIEALQFGHCLVVLPFLVDQGLNARFLVEKGLAFEVERGDDGSFERSDIARALRGAMVGKEGEGMRARSRDVAAVVGDREIHEGYIAGLVEFLKSRIN
ncbi:hypothetical protein RHGRI_019049 [Rhododendron griersonianum]|uniref:UDP-rhamnose:rhamnosyltransferase 1 n=1 Tax=Rhododendron griersonianum TaxID=479676 RepID=A0AAV6JFX0_9ERIC|nr:hypothetical protein RHGRI_019049 [Rhododendron griersonianum]